MWVAYGVDATNLGHDLEKLIFLFEKLDGLYFINNR